MMSGDGILERSHRLHQQLLERRLADARCRHADALARLQQAIADNHPNGDRHPEGWREILNARFVEAEALSEYITALRAYSTAPEPPLHVV